jgi:uncharacterized protein (TIGR00251 family)
MYNIQRHASGCLLKVRALPGSRRNELCGEHQGQLKIAVTQIAEQGKANKAIIATLAKSTTIKKSQITLVSGELTRNKVLLIAGCSPEQLQNELSELEEL